MVKTPFLDAASQVFEDRLIAEKFLEDMRWPEGNFCPDCGGDSVTRKTPGSGGYKCNNCSRSWSLRQGTCMEGSKLRLDCWAVACTLYRAGLRGPEFQERFEQITDVRKLTAAKILERLSLGGLPGPADATPDQVGPLGKRRGPVRLDGRPRTLNQSWNPHWLIPLSVGALGGAVTTAVAWIALGLSTGESAQEASLTQRYVGELPSKDGQPSHVSWVGPIRVATKINIGETSPVALDRHLEAVQTAIGRSEALSVEPK